MKKFHPAVPLLLRINLPKRFAERIRTIARYDGVSTSQMIRWILLDREQDDFKNQKVRNNSYSISVRLDKEQSAILTIRIRRMGINIYRYASRKIIRYVKFRYQEDGKIFREIRKSGQVQT